MSAGGKREEGDFYSEEQDKDEERRKWEVERREGGRGVCGNE